MKQDEFNKKEMLIELGKCIFIGISFLSLDVTLRFLTRWLGYYSIYALAPSLFSLCWIGLFLVAFSLFPRKTGRIVYAVWFGVWAVYSVCQYVYYLIFNSFFFLSDIRNATEGAEYLNFVSEVLDVKVFLMLGGYLALGIAGYFLFPNFCKIGNRKCRSVLRVILCLLSSISMVFIPYLYVHNEQALFMSSCYEYEQFSNSAFDLEITGLYQYIARDTWKSYMQPPKSHDALYGQVETYLDQKPTSVDNNEMAGVLKGKNVILIQMESIDDWVLSETTMPTVSRLMQEGINFT